MNLTLHVERVAHSIAVGRGQISGARPFCMRKRLFPVSGQLKNLGAVHLATAAKRHELGLCLAPFRERRCPLAGTFERKHPLTRRDHGAVDDPGHDRRQLAGRSREHALIKKRQAFLDATGLYQSTAFEVPAEGHEVGLGELLTDRSGPLRRLRRRFEIAAHELLSNGHQEQVARFGAVLSTFVHEPLAAAEPRRAPSHLAQKHHPEAEPKRETRGGQFVLVIQVQVIEPLEKLQQCLISAGERGRPSEPFQVRSGQRLLFVESTQCLEGPAPQVLVIEPARSCQRRSSLQPRGHGSSFPIAGLSDKPK